MTSDTETAPDMVEDSKDHLQKSLHSLLERHGVMQNVRAHLRHQLVGIVRGAQSGEAPVGKELLSQRLDLKFQALNILIAEYLMAQEFNYTLSVFVSELPLANMVFHFAETLLATAERDGPAEVRFNEADVWHILNTLGVKCDSEHACRVVEAYENSPRRPPLLLCLLQSLQLYRATGEPGRDREKLSDRKGDSVQSCEECMIAASCLGCHSKVDRKKYATENKLFAKMFQQLKCVYETKSDMLRERQSKRLQRELASCEQRLRDKERQLEEEYRNRQEVLEQGSEEKKRFLWKLARSLRQRHSDLAAAVRALQLERLEIGRREEDLKKQLKAAEDNLKTNGEHLREQLARELKLMEQHVEAMRVERDSITQEREQLEKLKQGIPNQSDEAKTQFEEQKRKNEDLQKHYENLKDELSDVKSYIAAAKCLDPRLFVESSSMTDIFGVYNHCRSLNNEEVTRNAGAMMENVSANSSATDVTANMENILMNNFNALKHNNQLVNDLTKLKNVNLRNNAAAQVNLEAAAAPATDEVLRELLTELRQDNCSLRTFADQVTLEVVAAPATDEVLRELLTELRQDNCSLRTFADQQREHIRELTSGQAKLRAELASVQHAADNTRRLAAAASSLSSAPVHSRFSRAPACWGVRAGGGGGGGEESPPHRFDPAAAAASAAASAASASCRLLTGARSNDFGKRAHVTRLRPSSPRTRTRLFAPRARDEHGGRGGAPPRTVSDIPNVESTAGPSHEELARPRGGGADRIRQEEVELDYGQHEYPVAADAGLEEGRGGGGVSPTSEMLLAAKKRLRKLEMEAEAVEQSYVDFRTRHAGDAVRASLNTADDVYRQRVQPTEVDSHSQRALDRQSNTSVDNYQDIGWQNTMASIDVISKVNPLGRKDEYKAYYYRCENKSQQMITQELKQKYDDIIYCDAKIRPKDVEIFRRKGKLVETPLKEFRKLYQTDYKDAPTANIHRAMKVLSNNEPLQGNSRENIDLSTLASKSKSTTDLRTAKQAALKLLRKKSDEHSSKLTEKQLEVLRSNIRKQYNIPVHSTSTRDVRIKSTSQLNEVVRKEVTMISKEVSDVSLIKLTNENTQAIQTQNKQHHTIDILYGTSNAEGAKANMDYEIITIDTNVDNSYKEKTISTKKFPSDEIHEINCHNPIIKTDSGEHEKVNSAVVTDDSIGAEQKTDLARGGVLVTEDSIGEEHETETMQKKFAEVHRGESDLSSSHMQLTVNTFNDITIKFNSEENAENSFETEEKNFTHSVITSEKPTITEDKSTSNSSTKTNKDEEIDVEIDISSDIIIPTVFNRRYILEPDDSNEDFYADVDNLDSPISIGRNSGDDNVE